MKAVVFDRYGGPEALTLREVDKPVPDGDQVLIKVYATSVTTAECMLRAGEPKWGRLIAGITRPRKRMRTLGTELAGQVEAVGRDVKRFQPGDQVYGFAGFNIGANAQYMCLPAKASLALKPVNKSFEDSAAAVDGATTAMFFLMDKAKLRAGQRVLVNGASGSIGTFAVQLAKLLGAHVTAVCSGKNSELVQTLGADEVIDYTRQDFTRNLDSYDIIFDTVGKSSFRRCRKALTAKGRYMSTTGLGNVLWALATSITGGKRVLAGMSVDKNDALAHLKDLLETDQLTVVIDRRYPLTDIVEAHRYVQQGRKRGNIVITIPH